MLKLCSFACFTCEKRKLAYNRVRIGENVILFNRKSGYLSARAFVCIIKNRYCLNDSIIFLVGNIGHKRVKLF